LTGTSLVLSGHDSLAGSIHQWPIITAYYRADVPVWIDVIENLEQWKAEFLKAEAKEVVQALGAVIYVFAQQKESLQDADSLASLSKSLSIIDEVISLHCGDEWDGLKIAAMLPTTISSPHVTKLTSFDEFDDTSLEYGFEFVDCNQSGKNEFGELKGFERIKEAVEANEWDEKSTMTADEQIQVAESDIDIDLFEDRPSTRALLLDEAFSEDMDEPAGVDEEMEVQKLEGLMHHAMAIKGEFKVY